MADAKVSALSPVIDPASTDEFPVNQGGTSKKMTLAQVRGADNSYGMGIGFDALANTRLDNVNTKVYFRFRSPFSSALQSFRFYLLSTPDGAGYGGGTGGALTVTVETDDGTANHYPSGTAIATQAVAADAVGSAGKLVTFSSPPTLDAGTLYHIVIANTDASPSVNYCSPDFGWVANTPTGRLNPAFSNTDWAHGYFSGGSWTSRGGFTPILDLGFAAGHYGSAYIETSYGFAATTSDAGDTINWSGNPVVNGDRVRFSTVITSTGISAGVDYYVVNRTGTTFQVSLTNGGAALPITTDGVVRIIRYGTAEEVGQITGTSKMVRELFTVTGGDKYVTAVGLRVLRESGTDDLNVTLETSTGQAVATTQLPYASVTVGDATNFDTSGLGYYVEAPLTATLLNGQTYRLRLSCPSGSTYWAFAIRKGVQYLYAPVTYYADGKAQQTLDGTNWNSLGRVTDENDLQFYLTTTPSTGWKPGEAIPRQPGNFFTPTDTSALFVGRVRLTGTQRASLVGTARMRIL